MSRMSMCIYSTKKGLSYKDRIKILSHIIGEYGSGKDGFLEKFNNSYGFKDVEWHTDGGAVIEAVVESPEEYETPYVFLLTSRKFLDKPDELLTFIFDVKDVKHPVDKFSYNTLDIMLKFQKFLYKVLPDIRIEFDILEDDFKPLYKHKILGHFIFCIAESEIVDTELSGHRLLKKKEVNYILNIVKEIVSYEPVLTQFWCETCHEYHPDCPYHIQLDDKRYA